MQYRRLGRTGLNVSAICLGTMTWGQQNTGGGGPRADGLCLREGHQLLRYRRTLFDSATGRRRRARRSASSAPGSRTAAARDKIILATKVIGRSEQYLVPGRRFAGRTVPRAGRGGGQQEPQAPADGLYRPLSDPLARPAHAVGLEPRDLPPREWAFAPDRRDPRRPRRSRERRQDPPHRPLERERLGHHDIPEACCRARPSPGAIRPERLQPAQPHLRDRPCRSLGARGCEPSRLFAPRAGLLDRQISRTAPDRPARARPCSTAASAIRRRGRNRQSRNMSSLPTDWASTGPDGPRLLSCRAPS